MSSALAGWHRGELSIQKKLGLDKAVRTNWTWISGEMPEQHRTFHTTRLPFLPVTTLDESGRPWTSILAGKNGEPGFVSSPSYNQLSVKVDTWEGDPLMDNIKLFGKGKGKTLIAGIGVEFPTRRRNKLAGHITNVQVHGDSAILDLEVNQAIGNCPKYINIRDLIPHPDTSPSVVYKKLFLEGDERLPDELISFVVSSDTVFLGSSYEATESDQAYYPSHLGQNHRGGRAGFIRVRPSDGRTLVLPDYSGNRMLTSLGNIEATPLASLTFVGFSTGDVLYLTGEAHTLVGPEAQALMPRQNVVTTVRVTGYTFVRSALPVRERPGSEVERSPYSPPIRLLAEEDSATSKIDGELPTTLIGIELHSNDLATFTWEASTPVHILPGQTAVLDFTDLLGTTQYSHMAAWKPSSINDDRIRTWTVSSSHLSPNGTAQFSLTMREKPGGAVTGALFNIARRLAEVRPELLPNTRPLDLRVKLVGIAGEFILEKPLPSSPAGEAIPLLWIAGGIGVTPFLSMLSAIGSSFDDKVQWDVVLVLSTREPQVLLPLFSKVLGSITGSPKLRLVVNIFSHQDMNIPAFSNHSTSLEVTFKAHNGRLPSSVFSSDVPDVKSRTIYLCGPQAFERSVLAALSDVGVSNAAVRREGFDY